MIQRIFALSRIAAKFHRLRRDGRGVALIEFAYCLPVVITFCVGGLELANFITVKMRISQIALHVADHAARIGEGSALQAKTVSETAINDVLTGSGLQAGELNLYPNGRVILSSLEPVANPNTTNRYKIAWQRCRGTMVHASTFGVAGATNLVGMGPATRQVTAPDDGATMFVEVSYRYRPLIVGSFIPATDMVDIATMPVRDRRDLAGGTNGVYNIEGATPSTC